MTDDLIRSHAIDAWFMSQSTTPQAFEVLNCHVLLAPNEMSRSPVMCDVTEHVFMYLVSVQRFCSLLAHWVLVFVHVGPEISSYPPRTKLGDFRKRIVRMC